MAIEAEQTEQDGETVRNDRLLAIACKSHLYRDVAEIDDLPPNLVDEVEHFWVSYNELKGKKFVPIGRADAASAKRLLHPRRKRRI